LDNKKTNIEQWEFKLHVCKHEALLSQYVILQSMNKSDRVLLLRHALDNNNSIQKSGKYSTYSYESNLFLTIRILFIDNYEILNTKLKEDKNQTFFN
jgi:hypothetical protein